VIVYYYFHLQILICIINAEKYGTLSLAKFSDENVQSRTFTLYNFFIFLLYFIIILKVNVISRVQLQTVGFYYILSKLVGSGTGHVVGFYYIIFSFLVTYILTWIIHIRVNDLANFYLKSSCLCCLLSLSESFFQFYHLVWSQT
jgi:hypothetical protein